MIMLKSRGVRILLAVAVLTLGTRGVARASLICPVIGTCYGTATIGPATTDLTGSPGYTLTLPKFDSTYGTLTSVTLYFTASETVSSFSINNTAASTQNAQVWISSDIATNGTNTANNADNFFADYYLTLFNTGGAPGGPACHAGYYEPGTCGPISIPAHSSTSEYGPFTVNLTDAHQSALNSATVGTAYTGLVATTSGALTSGDWVNYEAGNNTSTFAFTGGTLIGTDYAGGGGNFTLNQATNITLTAEVDYTYAGPGPAPTPEPATMGLMGSALIGLGLFAKKYARRNR
jgi:hypothetical protein